MNRRPGIERICLQLSLQHKIPYNELILDSICHDIALQRIMAQNGVIGIGETTTQKKEKKLEKKQKKTEKKESKEKSKRREHGSTDKELLQVQDRESLVQQVIGLQERLDAQIKEINEIEAYYEKEVCKEVSLQEEVERIKGELAAQIECNLESKDQYERRLTALKEELAYSRKELKDQIKINQKEAAKPLDFPVDPNAPIPLTLWQKLVEIGKHVPCLTKDSHSALGFDYVSSSQVLEAIAPKMHELGVLLKQEITEQEVNQHPTSKGGKTYHTQITCVFTWINADDPKQQEKCVWAAQGFDTQERGIGKAASYAEKTFLMSFFHIPTPAGEPQQSQQWQQPRDYQQNRQWQRQPQQQQRHQKQTQPPQATQTRQPQQAVPVDAACLAVTPEQNEALSVYIRQIGMGAEDYKTLMDASGGNNAAGAKAAIAWLKDNLWRNQARAKDELPEVPADEKAEDKVQFACGQYLVDDFLHGDWHGSLVTGKMLMGDVLSWYDSQNKKAYGSRYWVRLQATKKEKYVIAHKRFAEFLCRIYPSQKEKKA